MLRRLAIAILFLAAASLPLFGADTYTIDKSHSDVSFRIRHFTSKVRGRFTDFSGTIQADTAKPETSSVAFTIKSSSVDTNNADRDNHLRSPEFFDAAKNPEMTFKSTKITPTGKDQFNVTGPLTMRGVTKEVTLPVTYLGSVKDPGGNERAGFEIVAKLNRKDWGFNWNKTLDAGGVMLSDDVEVTISLETVNKK